MTESTKPPEQFKPREYSFSGQNGLYVLNSHEPFLRELIKDIASLPQVLGPQLLGIVKIPKILDENGEFKEICYSILPAEILRFIDRQPNDSQAVFTTTVEPDPDSYYNSELKYHIGSRICIYCSIPPKEKQKAVQDSDATTITDGVRGKLGI
jgi:hypothetical protein